MAEEMKNQEKKGGGLVKGILVLLVFIIVIPALAIAGFYFMNDTFQYRMNAALVDAPIVGSYFDSLPTRAEKNDQIKAIAEFFLEKSVDSAVDKLIIINTDEKDMYDEIIRTMLQIDPNATKVILEEVRAKQLKGDAVSATLDEITEERNQDLQAIATELETMPFSSLRSEMYKILNDGLNGYSRLARIFEQMDAVKAYELLSLLDDIDEASVLDAMEFASRDLIQQEKNKDLANTQRIISLSEIYASKDPDELLSILSDTTTYSLEELAIIFKELGVVKTGQILAKADDAFVNNVITQMKNNEVLENGEDLITKDILKTLNIYNNFDDSIIEMANIYKTMQPSEVAPIISKLLTDGALPTVYVLDGGEVITISDEDLAYKLLEQFDDKVKAEIIGTFNTTLASEVSKKLTVPEY